MPSWLRSQLPAAARNTVSTSETPLPPNGFSELTPLLHPPSTTAKAAALIASDRARPADLFFISCHRIEPNGSLRP